MSKHYLNYMEKIKEKSQNDKRHDVKMVKASSYYILLAAFIILLISWIVLYTS